MEFSGKRNRTFIINMIMNVRFFCVKIYKNAEIGKNKEIKNAEI